MHGEALHDDDFDGGTNSTARISLTAKVETEFLLVPSIPIEIVISVLTEPK